jgi:hypothetical protein
MLKSDKIRFSPIHSNHFITIRKYVSDMNPKLEFEIIDY